MSKEPLGPCPNCGAPGAVVAGRTAYGCIHFRPPDACDFRFPIRVFGQDVTPDQMRALLAAAEEDADVAAFLKGLGKVAALLAPV